MTKTQIVQLATVFGIPFAIALLKHFIPKIPKKLIPVLCPVLGALADVLSSGTIGQGTTYGAALGFAAVGVREAWDQLSGKAQKPKEPAPPPTP